MTDARGVELIDWLDENWQRFETSRGLNAAAMQHFRPVLDANEQEWLMRQWFRLRETHSAEEAAPVHGARGAAEGSSPEPIGSSPGDDPADVAFDPETGEVLEEDIPFDVDDEPEPEAAETSTELVPAGGQLVNLFGSGGPEEALEAVEKYADAFRKFITEHDLALEMEDGSLYVTAPGVEAGGQMTGWFTEIEMTEQIEGGWKARAYAHQPLTGRRGASREAICMRAEKGKTWKPENDLLSQAQTRACRKALTATLSIIWNAAGYDAAAPEDKPHTPKQRAMLFAIFNQLQTVKPKPKVGKEDGWKHWATQGTLARFGKRISGLNRGEMTWTIERVKQLHEELSSNGDGDYEPSEEELRDAEGIEFG